MGFVDDENIPFKSSDVRKLTVLAAKIDGALEILQAHEFDEIAAMPRLFIVVESIEILLPTHHERLSG